MSIFFKYVLKKTAMSCVIAVLVFVGVLILGNAVRDIFDWVASGRLSLLETGKILSIIIPSMVSYALPVGMFAGILISISRLSVSNELLTMKSIGWSIYRISLPIFLIVLVATILSCFVNLYYAPDSITEYKRSFKKVLKENPVRFIRSGEFIRCFQGYIIYVDSIHDDDLQRLKIWQLGEDDISCYISAKHGKISYDSDSSTILLKLFGGNAEYFDRKHSLDGHNPDMLSFNELSVSLPITGIINEDTQTVKKLRYMNLNELLYARENWHADPSETLTPEIIKRDRRMVDMQISSNIAMAFGIVAMSLIAIPLGIRKNRADTSINILLAVVFAFIYYFAMVALSWMGKYARIHAEMLVWLPNIVLSGIGICMLRKVARN
ncbi:MAG: LptF/LptG family permease [Opitutales bacterium]|nr:LptF/LptG family permease [Opitutales bacterium]